ncbi:hypothetical protein [Treponema sp.]|uniref:hypothetical protein n=1 Tax=Treponema sp. TaxID=166 RepID=UPI0025F2DF6A|nr:hypothetical protein [Treponema sp.]MBR4321518.1 hypothetical protein [Treponema sp.]
MTDDELLIESLSIIQKQIKEELDAEKGESEASKEIRQDYEEVLELLGYIVPKIKGIDSLYEELDEDEFAFIAECLENYQDNFVIDGRNPQKLKEDEEKYSQLSDILFELYDDDDEEDDGEDYEESDGDEDIEAGLEEDGK